MRKAIALLAVTGLLAGCSSEANLELDGQSTQPGSSSVEKTPEEVSPDSDQESMNPDSDEDTSGDEMSDMEAETLETEHGGGVSAKNGGELLQLAQEMDLLDCYEVLGPDSVVESDGTELIIWYCNPEPNVGSSLTVDIRVLESAEDVDGAIAESERTLGGLMGFTFQHISSGQMFATVFSEEADWNPDLPSQLETAWDW